MIYMEQWSILHSDVLTSIGKQFWPLSIREPTHVAIVLLLELLISQECTLIYGGAIFLLVCHTSGRFSDHPCILSNRQPEFWLAQHKKGAKNSRHKSLVFGQIHMFGNACKTSKGGRCLESPLAMASLHSCLIEAQRSTCQMPDSAVGGSTATSDSSQYKLLILCTDKLI